VAEVARGGKVPDSTSGEHGQHDVREQLQAKRENVRRRRGEAAAKAGEILSAWRKGSGIQQGSLAKMASVSPTVVRRIEKGDYGSVPESLISAVRDLGGPARELRDSNLLEQKLKGELAELTGLLARREPQAYIEQDPSPPDAESSSAGPVVVGPVPYAAPAFQRRAGLLDALAKSCPDAQVVRALTGMRGVGKSQLAAAYARSRIVPDWRLVAWVNAADSAQVVSGLAEVAVALKLDAPDAEGLAGAVRHRLTEDGGRCLIVFDDVTDVDALAAFLPSGGQSQVVITSNLEQTAAFGLHIPVEVFTPAQALSFLAQRTGRDDAEGAAELASAVGFLPLALAQAAAVIAEQRLDYRTFLTRLKEIPVQHYLLHVAGDPYLEGVGETVALALDAAVRADRTGLAHDLISLMALLSADGVPRSLLYAAGLHGDLGPGGLELEGDPEKVVDDALGKLASMSLLTFSDNWSAVAGHRLTMRVVLERAAAADDGTMVRVAAGAIRVLRDMTRSMPDPRQDRTGARDTAKQVIDLHEHLSRFLGSHDDPMTAELLRLRCWAMECLVRQYDGFSQVVQCGPAVVADCERIFGPENEATLHARTNLATAFYQAGQLDAAASLSRLNLAVCQRAAGNCGKETLAVRHNLALVMEDAGNLEEAIDLWQQLLGDRERELGPDDEDTMATRNDLAHAYEQNGDLDKAVPMRELLLNDSIRVFGPDHENAVVCRNNLARAYELAGRPEEATPMYEQTLASFVTMFGADHPYSLQCRHNVAGAYRLTGRLTEAISLYKQVISERDQILGSLHPETLRSRNNLALALAAAGRVAGAIELMARTATDREQVLGNDHPDTRKSQADLALMYRKADRRR
jgi:tetratricopeptide (TPR) repeat protein/transcriptional regulator with XRE-family HTH domain